jgi:hypothetical protein
MRENLRAACTASCLIFGLAFSQSTHSSIENYAGSGPRNAKFERTGEINVTRLKKIEASLKKSPGFDLKNNKVIEIFTWEGSSGPGIIAAVREGVGGSAGCAIYEKVGDLDFEYVNGEPFCRFSKPSGRVDRKSTFGIKFVGKIRQSGDSPINPMEFELSYDEQKGFFCDALSSSDKYSCKVNSSDQRKK